MNKITRNYIGGEWIAPSTAETRLVVDPATHEVVGSAPKSGTADVDRAVAAARAAFPGWAATSRSTRAKALTALNDLNRGHATEPARLVQLEMGAPFEFAFSEHVGTPIAIIDDYAEQLGHEPEDERVGASLIVHEPIGVVAAILPWNYPLYQLVAKVVPAIAAGCTVVAKPSELTPLATHRLTELIEKAGFPAGVFNLVAQRVAPESRIVYVDFDPLVLSHARALLTSSAEGATQYVDADGRHSAKVLAEAASTLDFGKPVALIMSGLLGHVTDAAYAGAGAGSGWAAARASRSTRAKWARRRPW